MHTYVIPYQGKYIVYQPLKRLAFLANSALVNLIVAHQNDPASSGQLRQQEAFRFLDEIGVFEPDPPFTPPASRENKAFKPTVAVCLMTTQCNFRCIYCYASGGEGVTKELPFELGQRAIDTVFRNAQDLGQDSFAVSFHGGGEPTLAQRNFRKLVLYAKSKEIPCETSVASNGYWGRQQREWILENLDQVSLSFDGLQVLQDRQRPLTSGKGSFKVVMETIQAMDQRAFPYGIRLTVTDEGIEHLAQSIEFLCRETDCRTFQVEPAFNHGRATRNDLALNDNRRFASAFMEAHHLAVAQGRHLYYSGARPWVVTDRFCQAVDNALIVSADGGLTSCYEVFGPEHPLASEFFFGSLGLDGQLTETPNARQSLQEKIAERKALCEGCFCYWHCAGDCPPKTLSPDGDGHRQFGARCDLNRLITQELLLGYMADGNGLWQGELPGAQQICEG